MRVLVLVCVSCMLALGAASAAAQPSGPSAEATALRRDLEQMRQQFDAARQSYEKAIEALNERLKRLETAPPPVAAPPPAVGAAPAPSLGAPAAQPAAPSALDLLRPRQPFGLYSQRGSGQLLFDMGVTGDFIGNVVSRRVDRADAGTFAGRENRFFPREIELSLFGQVDPYASAYVRIEAGEEEPGQETGVSLAEAAITLLTLPYGTQVKLGQLRNRFGYTNEIHEHDLPWIDRPNVLVRFLGEEGLVEKGGELKWVPDLPVFVEALVGVFNGDNETAFGRGKLDDPLVTGRVRTFFELSDTSALQLGASLATGTTGEDRRNTLIGGDVRYKYRPEGWLHPLFTFTSEGIYAIRRVTVERDGVADATETVQDRKTRHRFGWYAGGEVQPWRRWALGLRYDWTELPESPGREWALEPYLSFWPSEFLRFRLGYKHTERDHQELFNLTGNGRARLVDELLLQATFILGAHPAHPF